MLLKRRTKIVVQTTLKNLLMIFAHKPPLALTTTTKKFG